MKKIALSFYLLIICGFAFSQAREGVVEHQKSQQPAALIELPYNQNIVNDAMNDYLSKKGKSKGNDLKGFITFRNTGLLQNDSANADLYFKVERKSRQEKETSVIYLLLTTPKEGAQANVHYMDMEQAKSYLNDLAPAIESYNLELLIKDQNEKLLKAESKYKDLSEENTDLEKKRTGIDKKIAENKSDMNNQVAEIAAQKQKLSVLVNQRKPKSE
jgi:hypothetical protein